MDLLDDFIEKYTIGVEKELIRPDTLRTYTSHVKNFKLYLKKFEFENITCKDFNKAFVVKFVDYLDKHKKLRARTTNNYITFLNQFCIFMVDRGILENNPATTIKKRKEGTKIRRLIPEHIKQKIFSYLKNKNKRYFILCLMTYLCFVRRTELTKLKVKHVSLYDGLLNIPAHISKNGLDGHVTIPNVLIEYLAEHLAEANNEDFIFSKNDFFPGDQQLRPKYISDEWTKMRTKLKLPSYYQFYSLKDTGITEYIKKGMDLLSVRDQARHQEIKTTESYMPRSNSANETIRNVDVAI